jgi:hypothetical protein
METTLDPKEYRRKKIEEALRNLQFDEEQLEDDLWTRQNAKDLDEIPPEIKSNFGLRVDRSKTRRQSLEEQIGQTTASKQHHIEELKKYGGIEATTYLEALEKYHEMYVRPKARTVDDAERRRRFNKYIDSEMLAEIADYLRGRGKSLTSDLTPNEKQYIKHRENHWEDMRHKGPPEDWSDRE